MADIVVKKKVTPYKLLNVTSARDKRLSYKARGILFYLLSKPDGWTCHVFDLCKNSDKDGQKSVQSAMKELSEMGYARLKRYKKNADNKFMGTYYEIQDEA